MNKDDPFEVELSRDWQDYGFDSPDEMIEARRAYGGVRDELNPLLRGRRIRSQSSSGGFLLGAFVGFLVGKGS